MHRYYQVNEKVFDFDKEKLKQFLEFRMAFLDEELTETKNAVRDNDAEEIVDGLIDLCVVAIGTLDAMGIDSYNAWDRVLRANMAKEVGVKASRPNPLGLPDLIKPAGWEAPSHAGNHGLLARLK
jgi:predicted HAD superfamily Cof-like phosphohydrolase